MNRRRRQSLRLHGSGESGAEPRLFARGDAKAKIVVSLKPSGAAATTLRKTLPLKLGD